MHKSKKAALAAVAGGGLLLGGLGSLAYWEDAESATGGTVTSGTLDLIPTDCEQWVDGDGQTVTLSTFRMVPGDELSRSCLFTVDIVGDNLETALSFVPPALTPGTLASELTFGAQYAVSPGADPAFVDLPSGTPAETDLVDGDTIEVEYTVALPFAGNEADASGVDNDSNSGDEFNPGPELTAVLGDLTVTLRQV